MNKNDYSIEDELNAIRTENYEHTKNMTSAERVAYVNESAAHILEQLGVKPVTMEIAYSSPQPGKSIL